MSWLDRYRFKLYVRNSIWIFPVLSIFAGLITVVLLNRIEVALGWTMNLRRETAQLVMSAVASSMFTLVVISSSAVLLAVQLASAQLTPRIIALLYRNNIRKFSLSVFAFTFTFAIAVLVRIEESVPLLTGYLAAYGFLINLAFFVYFVDGMGKTLRPSSAVRMVALAARQVIKTVYPDRLNETHSSTQEPIRSLKGIPRRVVLNEKDGVVLAFDLQGLVSVAERYNCVIELVPQVGDFIAANDTLFRIFDGGENLNKETLLRSVALGEERTLEQDPMFAFRIIVDIATKALSPAINDPTTAVLCIDQIHHLLRDVGTRYLAEGREADTRDQLRLAYRTPNWDDFVHLAITEIRQYGRDSVQIMRRLRAMLDNLIETLPDRRAPLLRDQLKLLERSSKRTFPDENDQILAVTGDSQGMGGGHKLAHEHDDKQVTAVA